MSKKTIPPFFDVKAPFVQALDNYCGRVGVLASAVNSVLTLSKQDSSVINPRVAEILREAYDEYRKASVGE